jgi:hypothetical protein
MKHRPQIFRDAAANRALKRTEVRAPIQQEHTKKTETEMETSVTSAASCSTFAPLRLDLPAIAGLRTRSIRRGQFCERVEHVQAGPAEVFVVAGCNRQVVPASGGGDVAVLKWHRPAGLFQQKFLVGPTVQGGTLVFYMNRTVTDQVAGFASELRHSIGRKQMLSNVAATLKGVREQSSK